MSQVLLIQESPMQALPSLMATVGVSDAIVLQQMHYWLSQDWVFEMGFAEIDNRGRKFLTMTYDDMRERALWFLSKRTLQRIVERLSEKEVIDLRSGGNGPASSNKVAINYGVLEILQEAASSLKGDTLSSIKGDNLSSLRVTTCHPSPYKEKKQEKSKSKEGGTLSPRVLEYAQATQMVPPTDQHSFIESRMTSPIDVDLLREVFGDWRARGYRRDNVAGVLDWYVAKLNGVSTSKVELNGTGDRVTRIVAIANGQVGQVNGGSYVKR